MNRVSSSPTSHDAPTASHAPLPEDDVELIALVVRAQTGDLGAQSDLVRRYTRRITGIVHRIIPQRSAVEDVVQEASIKMVRWLERLRDPRAFESWLFALARNAALDAIRRRRCQPTTVSDNFLLLAAPESGSAQAVGEIMAAFERAMAHLREKDRRLIASIVQGHSYEWVAEREGLTVGAVKLRIHRLRPRLRLAMGEAVGVRLAVPKPSPRQARGRLAA